MRKNHRILDFGCGAGLFLDFLKKQGYSDVSGYDAFVENYSDPNTLSGTYDVVLSQDVLEHFDDPREFFQMTSGCVKPGGVLIVGTPNADEIDLSDPEEFLWELHQPYHRHILTENAQKKIGREFGLDCFATDNRFYLDTLFPIVNMRFIKRYVRESGNDMDVVYDPPKIGLVLSRPALWFSIFAGYFYRSPGNVVMYYKKNAN
jgi:SAM-dependent methyltransferase